MIIFLNVWSYLPKLSWMIDYRLYGTACGWGGKVLAYHMKGPGFEFRWGFFPVISTLWEDFKPSFILIEDDMNVQHLHFEGKLKKIICTKYKIKITGLITTIKSSFNYMHNIYMLNSFLIFHNAYDDVKVYEYVWQTPAHIRFTNVSSKRFITDSWKRFWLVKMSTWRTLRDTFLF